MKWYTISCTANCGCPELLLTENNDSVPTIEGYEDLIPIEGSTVRFRCPPGWELIGPDSAICTENGEWEPDPRQLMCIESKFNSEGTMLLLKYLKIVENRDDLL